MADNHKMLNSKPRQCKVVIRMFKGKPEYCGMPLGTNGKCPEHG